MKESCRSCGNRGSRDEGQEHAEKMNDVDAGRRSFEGEDMEGRAVVRRSQAA